jgi:hypothetical protein
MKRELNREKKWVKRERQPYIAIARILVLYNNNNNNNNCSNCMGEVVPL